MKVLTFSRFFPKGHPRQGQPTVFVPKIWACPGITITDSGWDLPEMKQFSPLTTLDHPKGHTIRAGNRWKVGDMASLRVWSDKPYRSKQIEFAQVEVKKVWEFSISDGNFSINTIQIGSFHPFNDELKAMANNDGLDVMDFYSWFAIHPKTKGQEFKGQIIAWNENINYTETINPNNIKTSKMPKTCDNCGKPESSQYLVENGTDMWCLDCMRLNGVCISCAADIRPLVDDYFNYEEDRCPKCIKNETT